MNDLEQILSALKTLEGRGWPILVIDSNSNDSFVFVIEDRDILPIFVRFDLTLSKLDVAVIRDWVEEQIEARRLWGEYVAQLGREVWGDSHEGYAVRRATPLEVLQAAVEVTG